MITISIIYKSADTAETINRAIDNSMGTTTTSQGAASNGLIISENLRPMVQCVIGTDYHIINKTIEGVLPLSFHAIAQYTNLWTISGNMIQTGTPSPSSPIAPSECGDLETTGEHTGQYKISILSNSISTPVYLGEVQTTRKIKKLVIDGTGGNITSSGRYRITVSDKINVAPICTHYKGSSVTNYTELNDGEITAGIASYLTIYDSNCTTLGEYQNYFQEQFTNGTPVCVWYVLAESTDSALNEPLRKIGDYADVLRGEINNINISLIWGNNTVDVDTTLKPTFMTITYQDD